MEAPLMSVVVVSLAPITFLTFFALMNLLTDLTYPLLDPRVKL